MRINFTLNEDKPKDKSIIEFLETQYNAADYIKYILYQNATNNVTLTHSNTINTPIEVNEAQKSDENVQNCAEITQNEQVENIELTDEIMNFF
ncbi:MAG: hypothetical protein RR620_12035 [Clostridium sp.]